MGHTNLLDRIVDGPPGGSGRASEPAAVEIVVPVHNEVFTLERSVRRLRRYLDAHFPFAVMVTIADNASTDDTWPVAARLARTVPGVRAVHLSEKGRGRALRAVWSASLSPVLAYMDVDLSTDLAALLPLVAPLLSGHSDISIGTRLAPGSQVARGPRREVISRSYNLVIRAAVGRHFSDAQCGFKALTSGAVRTLLPQIEDDAWFFDTELLLAAIDAGMRIHEVPVDWDDDLDSRVDVLATARADLRGLLRVAGPTIAARALRASLFLSLALAGFLVSDGSTGPLLASAAAVALAGVPTAVRSVLRVRRRATALRRTGRDEDPTLVGARHSAIAG